MGDCKSVGLNELLQLNSVCFAFAQNGSLKQQDVIIKTEGFPATAIKRINNFWKIVKPKLWAFLYGQTAQCKQLFHWNKTICLGPKINKKLD